MNIPLFRLPLDLLFSGLLIASWFGLGYRFTAGMIKDSLFCQFSLSTALGAYLYAILIYMFGTFEVLNKEMVAVTSAGLLALAVSQPPARLFIRKLLGEFRRISSPSWGDFETSLGWLLAMVCLSLLVFGYAPPTGEDELHYQAALPQLWALTGKLCIAQDNYSSYLPLNAQLIYTVIFLLRGALAVKATVWLTAMLVAGTLYFFALDVVKLSRPTALLSVAIFLNMPFSISASGITSSDFLNLFFEISTIALLWTNRNNLDWRTSMVAGVLGGAAIGTRAYAGAWVAATALFLLIGPNPLAAIVFGVSALGAYAPWPIRNYILTGNPIFPATVGKFTTTDMYFGREVRKLAEETRYLFWRLPLSVAARDYTWGTGPLSASLLPFGFKRWKQPGLKALLILSLLTVIIFYAIYPPKAGSRYYSSTFLWVAILAAAGFDELSSCLRRSWMLFYRCTVFAFLIFPFGSIAIYFGAKRLPFLLGFQSTKKYLQIHYVNEEGFEMMQFILRALTKDSRVLFLGTNFPPRYYYDPFIQMLGTYHWPPKLYNLPTRKFATALTREKIGYLLLTPRWFSKQTDGTWDHLEGPWSPLLGIRIQPLKSPYFKKVFETANAILYQVASPRNP